MRKKTERELIKKSTFALKDQELSEQSSSLKEEDSVHFEDSRNNLEEAE